MKYLLHNVWVFHMSCPRKISCRWLQDIFKCPTHCHWYSSVALLMLLFLLTCKLVPSSCVYRTFKDNKHNELKEDKIKAKKIFVFISYKSGIPVVKYFNWIFYRNKNILMIKVKICMIIWIHLRIFKSSIEKSFSACHLNSQCVHFNF